MLKGIEYHGRLARRDGRPANPGTYTLRFALHSDETTRRANWTEDHPEVQVNPGGFFTVILGMATPMSADTFKKGPRWLSVVVVRKSEPGEETVPRVPLTGGELLLLDALERLEKRVAQLEAFQQHREEMPSPIRLADRLEHVEGQVTIVADGDLPSMARRLERLAARLDAIDEDDGRLDRIEDRLEDIDGEDGDLIDLNERVDQLEKGLARTRDHG